MPSKYDDTAIIFSSLLTYKPHDRKILYAAISVNAESHLISLCFTTIEGALTGRKMFETSLHDFH